MSKKIKAEIRKFLSDLLLFFKEFTLFIFSSFHIQFLRFEKGKGIFVSRLYKHRGKYSTKFVHSGMAGITALGVLVAPVLVRELEQKGINPWEVQTTAKVLSASIENESISTDFAGQQYRDSIVEYTVQSGDTVSTIAQKFDVSVDTIRWQNNLSSINSIKEGQVIQILPLTGVAHKVAKGDTIYSIAKKYDAEPQAIADYPFNTFKNDETFELAIGQLVMVPEGVREDDITTPSVNRNKQVTPDAGTVVASGTFVWPTRGTITQRFYWYHPGIDIANRAAPAILAADGGKVVSSGWDRTGYGNMVIIDHGNGYKTRYAHMQKLYVTVGQSVNRGDSIGQMGSTGHSTGTHLHFEIYKGATRINPLNVLR